MGVELALVFILAIVAWVLFSQTAQSKGKRGEEQVSSGLSRVLNAAQYLIINDVTLPSGDATTQIDHLVVSPYGVFVIETKNMSGWIFGNTDQATWTQVLFKRKHKFQNPIKQNAKHVKTVQTLFRLRPHQLHSVVVFTGDCTFKTEIPPGLVKGVSQLVEFILAKKASLITDHELQGLIADIQAKRFATGKDTDRAHIRNVKELARKRERGRVAGLCPRCGSTMVERANRNSGERFLGCTRYPQCKGTRPLQ